MLVGVISSPWTKHVYKKVLKNKICEKRNRWTCLYFLAKGINCVIPEMIR